MVRYRFSDFALSPQRRLLVRDGREVPLIPRYFDLLLLLVERRREAVHRREIFERVWGDVIVSDSALSQAVRTIRRTLDDDTREPRFIRTVSRHGYQFVFPDVIEEEEDVAPMRDAAVNAASSEAGATLRAAGADLDPMPGSRWRHATRLAATRGSMAAAGGALAGVIVGGSGGLILAAAPGSTAPFAIAPVLAMVGGCCGALGGGGVGTGLGVAEALRPRQRVLGMTVAAALGGGLVGGAVQWLSRWALAALLGLHLPVGGGLEGIVIGAAAGLGLALALAPRGEEPVRSNRAAAALVPAVCCGLAALALALSGRPLASGTIHALSHAAAGSQATLAPLGHLIGETDFGPLSRAILAFVEGAGFGLGLAWGLRRRPSDGRTASV